MAMRPPGSDSHVSVPGVGMVPSASMPTPYPATTTSRFMPVVFCTTRNEKSTSVLLSSRSGIVSAAEGTCTLRRTRARSSPKTWLLYRGCVV